MSPSYTPIKVTVAGEEVTIRSEQPQEHSRAVADHVDGAIRRIREMSPSIDTGKAAMLAALQVADELFRLKRDVDRGVSKLDEALSEANRLLPPAKRLKV
jgi:cell division protein ZapA